MTGSARRASAAASAVTGDVPDAVGTSSDSSGAALSPKRMHRPRPGPRGGDTPASRFFPARRRPVPFHIWRDHDRIGSSVARVSRERVRAAPSSIHGMAFRLRTAAAGVRISRVSHRTACVGVRAPVEGGSDRRRASGVGRDPCSSTRGRLRARRVEAISG